MKSLGRHRWTIGFIVGVLVVMGGYFALQHEAELRTETAAEVGREARVRIEKEGRARDAAIRATAKAQTDRVAAEALARDYTVCAQINDIRHSIRQLGLSLVKSDGTISEADLRAVALVNAELADKSCPPEPKVSR